MQYATVLVRIHGLSLAGDSVSIQAETLAMRQFQRYSEKLTQETWRTRTTPARRVNAAWGSCLSTVMRRKHAPLLTVGQPAIGQTGLAHSFQARAILT